MVRNPLVLLRHVRFYKKFIGFQWEWQPLPIGIAWGNGIFYEEPIGPHRECHFHIGGPWVRIGSDSPYEELSGPHRECFYMFRFLPGSMV